MAKPSRSLKPEVDVLVISDGLPRKTWPFDVMQEAEPSSDGLVRTVVVRTWDGSIQWDVRKVALIEGSE